jgi:hypothetical protein
MRIPVVIAAVTIFLSCAGMRVESVVQGARPAPIDSLFIEALREAGRDEERDRLAESLVFALSRRGFRAASYAGGEERTDAFRHRAVITVFRGERGDLFDRRPSLSVHLRIIDVRGGESVALVRLLCDGCDIADAECAARLAERIAAEVDGLAGK